MSSKKTLASGTMPTGRKSCARGPGVQELRLSPTAVCDIIRSCKEAGVAKLKFSDLEIEFTNSGAKEIVPLTGAVIPAEILQKQLLDESVVIEREEIRSKEDTLDQLLIENPLEMERLEAMGELEDAESQN